MGPNGSELFESIQVAPNASEYDRMGSKNKYFLLSRRLAEFLISVCRPCILEPSPQAR